MISYVAQEIFIQRSFILRSYWCIQHYRSVRHDGKIRFNFLAEYSTDHEKRLSLLEHVKFDQIGTGKSLLEHVKFDQIGTGKMPSLVYTSIVLIISE